MKLIVNQGVVDVYPALRIAFITAAGIDNTGVDESLQSLKREAANRLSVWPSDRINELVAVQAWREAYRLFGVKPKTSRPTAEAFLRRLIAGQPFPTISKAVDAYLLTETEHFLPVGGYDLAHIAGDIVLRHSPGGETFYAIGARESEVTRVGEVVYSDEARILTRKWNFRDCDECKITEDSTSIALFVEAPFDSVTTEDLTSAAEAIAQNIKQFCGGVVTTGLLDCSASGLETEIIE